MSTLRCPNPPAMGSRKLGPPGSSGYSLIGMTTPT